MNQADIDQQEWANSQNPSPDIGVDELTKFLLGLGISSSAPRCFDDPFDPISADWVNHTLAKEWKDLCNKLGLKPRGNESADCDDFASGCRWYAQVIHNRTNPGNAACVAEVAYKRIGCGEHAIFAAADRNPDRSLSIAFFESEPTATLGGFAIEVLKPITVTAEELKTITDIRF